MTGRPLPGFIYDPQTNRYYREQPASRVTTAYAQIAARTQERTLEAAFESAYQSVSRKYVFDTATWSFTESLSQNCRLTTQKFQDLLLGRVLGPTNLPVVVQAAADLYPSTVPGSGLLRISGGSRIRGGAWANEGARISETNSSNDNNPSSEETQLCSVSWDGPTTRVLGRPLHGFTFDGVMGAFVYQHPYVSFVASTDLGDAVYFAHLSENLEDCIRFYGIGSPTNSRCSHLALCDSGEVLAMVGEQDVYFVSTTSNNWSPVKLTPTASRNEELAAKAVGFHSNSPDGLLLSVAGKIMTFKDGRRAASFILPTGRAASQMFPDVERQTLYAETFHSELFMFDWRFPKKSTLAIQLPESLKFHGPKYSVDYDRNVIYSSFGPAGKLAAWDVRKLSMPMSTFSIGRPIGQLCQSPDTKKPMVTAYGLELSNLVNGSAEAEIIAERPRH
ncbi:hypothetical protein PSACC_01115 [Paramicrosporidium saccamoebae]|uniref:Uncharacterized protein n=1 Tax=Paramicrosporidium saccamoebae TaxID=1246581 RepID=A0A2H9TMR6_9FUNG|nr:hypothetical protein PSACC_01115 [Paramicrosporidium saccamoebae]